MSDYGRPPAGSPEPAWAEPFKWFIGFVFRPAGLLVGLCGAVWLCWQFITDSAPTEGGLIMWSPLPVHVRGWLGLGCVAAMVFVIARQVRIEVLCERRRRAGLRVPRPAAEERHREEAVVPG
jgi:hypothetical protein